MKMNPLIRFWIYEPAEMNGASSLTWLGGLLLLLFLHWPGLLAPRRRRPGICCTGPPPDLPPGAAPPPIRAVPSRIHLHLPFPRRPPPSLPCSSPTRPELQHERGQQPPGVERDTRDGERDDGEPGNVEGDRRTPKYPGSSTGYRWSGYRVIPASIFGVRVGWSDPLWTVLVGRRCSELKDYPGGAELSPGDVRIKLVCELPIPLFNTDRVALEISV